MDTEMPRLGSDLSLEPSLDEEDYIHETSDESDEDYADKWEGIQEDKDEELLRDIDEKF
jgi:hypothetical protein